MGFVFSLNGETEYVRVTVKDKEKIKGVVESVEKYPDSTVTHHFSAGRKVKEDNTFAWFEIHGHMKVVDKSPKLEAENAALQRQLEEQSDALIELADIIAGGEDNG